MESMPPEFQLLIACARTRLDPTANKQLGALVETDLDWQVLLTQARRHGVAPLVHRHLTRMGSSTVPQAVCEDLEAYTRQNALRNLALTHELLRILASLEDHSIQAVPYKGPVLAGSAYGDITLRSFKDLDILVREEDQVQAAERLQALGYVPATQGPNVSFHTSFVHQETGMMVELHHDVIRRHYFPTSLDLRPMWANVTSTNLLEQQVVSFTPEDTLLLLLLHGSKHEWQGLIWMCDVAEYLKAQPDLNWEMILQKAERARLSRMVGLGLILAQRVLGAPLSARAQSAVEIDATLPKLVRKILTRMHDDGHMFDRAILPYRLHLSMRSSLADRLPIYRRLALFLVRPNEQDRKVIKLPESLAAGYYLVRPLRLLAHYVAGSD